MRTDYELQNNILYDKVHAIMIRELLAFFKKSGQDIETEVPYNYYGNRGSVDLILYHTFKRLGIVYDILGMYEIESRIPRLEELIRKLKDRMEYFPPYFQQGRGLPKFDYVELFLVLLTTQENWRVVSEYLSNFQSAFARVRKWYPTDILRKGSDDEYQIKKAFIAFFDPLKACMLDINEDIMIEKEALPFQRFAAFRMMEIRSWEDMPHLRAELNSIKPSFSDAQQFVRDYEEYRRS